MTNAETSRGDAVTEKDEFTFDLCISNRRMTQFLRVCDLADEHKYFGTLCGLKFKVDLKKTPDIKYELDVMEHVKRLVEEHMTNAQSDFELVVMIYRGKRTGKFDAYKTQLRVNWRKPGLRLFSDGKHQWYFPDSENDTQLNTNSSGLALLTKSEEATIPPSV